MIIHIIIILATIHIVSLPIANNTGGGATFCSAEVRDRRRATASLAQGRAFATQRHVAYVSCCESLKKHLRCQSPTKTNDTESNSQLLPAVSSKFSPALARAGLPARQKRLRAVAANPSPPREL